MLKITIDLPEGIQSIWRTLEIREEATLVELADAIQASFAWGGVHKHEFIAADDSWKATNPQYGPPEFDDSYQNEEEVISLPCRLDCLSVHNPCFSGSITDNFLTASPV